MVWSVVIDFSYLFFMSSIDTVGACLLSLQTGFSIAVVIIRSHLRSAPNIYRYINPKQADAGICLCRQDS